MGDNGWTNHNMGECPTDPKTQINVRFRNGHEHGLSPAWYWRWAPWPDGPSDWDIVAWQVAKE